MALKGRGNGNARKGFAISTLTPLTEPFLFNRQNL